MTQGVRARHARPEPALPVGMEHHVYFWLKEDHKDDASRAEFEAGLEALLRIGLVQGGMWGRPSPVAPRPVCDQSWDYAISIRFATLADHNTYQDDPTHLAFLARFRESWAKVLVTDLG